MKILVKEITSDKDKLEKWVRHEVLITAEKLKGSRDIRKNEIPYLAYARERKGRNKVEFCRRLDFSAFYLKYLQQFYQIEGEMAEFLTTDATVYLGSVLLAW